MVWKSKILQGIKVIKKTFLPLKLIITNLARTETQKYPPNTLLTLPSSGSGPRSSKIRQRGEGAPLGPAAADHAPPPPHQRPWLHRPRRRRWRQRPHAPRLRRPLSRGTTPSAPAYVWRTTSSSTTPWDGWTTAPSATPRDGWTTSATSSTWDGWTTAASDVGWGPGTTGTASVAEEESGPRGAAAEFQQEGEDCEALLEGGRFCECWWLMLGAMCLGTHSKCI